MTICSCKHNKAELTLNRAYSYDPTRTLTLRNKFVVDMRKRFRKLAELIWETVAVNDAFGISDNIPKPKLLAAAGAGEFAFEYDTDKIESFREWLSHHIEEHLFVEGLHGVVEDYTKAIVGGPVTDEAARKLWANYYIRTAYQKSIAQARARLRASGVIIPMFEGLQPGQENIALAFNQPIHLDRVANLFNRTYRELKGITALMDLQISRLLSRGMAEGRNPRQLARMLIAAIEGGGGDLSIRDTLGRFIPARRRAEILARTEIIRAHHIANITEYLMAGVEGVTVQVEWLTARDDRVCQECKDFAYEDDGETPRVYTLKEIEPLIPKHPQCRCVAIPYEKALLELGE